jgi:hypothetical protein
VLISKGVTTWRRVLAHLPPAGPSGSAGPGAKALPGRSQAGLPAALTTELINILAAVALAGAGPDYPPSPHPAVLTRGDPR